MVPAERKDWFADGEAYEHYVGRWSRLVARLFLNWLSIARGLRWLDVGCGTGALTAVILNRANPERVVGVEPSQGFLSVARKNVEDSRAEFRLGDARALPVDDKEVDVAVSGLVLNFVPDKHHALNEMCRAVKPGGTIGAYVWDYSGDMQLMRYFWNGVRDLFPDGAERDEGRQFPICKPEALAELFRGVGLKAVDTCALDAPTMFSDFDDYWSPFLRGQGPAGAYCASLPEGDRVRLREHLKRTLPFNAAGRIDLIARAWAVRGVI